MTMIYRSAEEAYWICVAARRAVRLQKVSVLIYCHTLRDKILDTPWFSVFLDNGALFYIGKIFFYLSTGLLMFR